MTGAVVGAVGVNWTLSYLTNHFPDLWPFFLGGLFIAVVMFFPKGVVGVFSKLWTMVRVGKHKSVSAKAAEATE